MADLNEHEHVTTRRMPVEGKLPRQTLRPRTFLIALLSGLCLLAVTPVIAHADPPLAPNCSSKLLATGAASTHGAWGGALIYRRADGAICGYGIVRDSAGDGRCAHTALRWKHVNGRNYYDTGLWTCGTNSTNFKTWGWRNPTHYRSVDLLVWRDGSAASARRVLTLR